MKKLLFIATLTVSLFAGGINAAEVQQTKTLGEIHGATWPDESGFAVKGQCMQCHGDYEKLAEKTANLDPNPHRSHMGKVNCTECHTKDRASAEPKLMCNSCHNFTIRETKKK